MSATSSIAMLGAGAWGTALAIQLARNHHQVFLWDLNQEKLQNIQQTRINQSYLPGFVLPGNIHVCSDLSQVIHSCPYVFLAVPSHGFEHCLSLIKPQLSPTTKLCWGTKGMVAGRFLDEVATDLLGQNHTYAVLSGPSFAVEVANSQPTAVDIACPNLTDAQAFADLFDNALFRTYVNSDRLGTQMGGVVKNVLAIAVGAADSLGFGANTRAALLTRGLAEMIRLGEKLGAKPQTFYGLSGVGDLILTATDDQSRNRRFGLALGKGLSVADAQTQVGKVIEGARNAKEIYQLAQHHQVDMPIVSQVYQVLHNGLAIETAVQNLLHR